MGRGLSYSKHDANKTRTLKAWTFTIIGNQLFRSALLKGTMNEFPYFDNSKNCIHQKRVKIYLERLSPIQNKLILPGTEPVFQFVHESDHLRPPS